MGAWSIRSAKIQLSNKNIISRAINYLFPLEIDSQVDLIKSKDPIRCNQDITMPRDVLSKKAAIEACQRISKQLTEHATCILFCYPQECHGQ